MSKKNISGIYAITNKVNGKKYVGSSKSVYYRWNQSHRPSLRKGNHYNRHLQSAWNKYKESSFTFEILEECEKEESMLLEREGYWIENTRSWEREFGYNLTRIVDDKQVLSEESIQKRLSTQSIKDYWTTGTNAEIVEFFQQGMSKNAIAIKLGITRSAVYSCLEQNDLHENTGAGAVIKLTEEVRQQVKDLREQGCTWEEIIETVGVSETQLHRANAIIPDGKYCTDKVQRKSYRTVTPEVVKQVERFRNDGKKWEEIEIILGVSRFALHQNGITQMFKPISKKGTRNKMTKEKKKKILQLRKTGKTLKEISVITGVAQSTMRYHGLHKV